MQYTTSAALLGFLASAHAHVFMNTPKIFPGTISSPLADKALFSGGFPCQKPVTWTADIATNMILGSIQPLSFTGSAVHGGGSCQISITYDQSPTKDSVWKVIHSIEGGCPMRNIDSNNGDDASLVSPSKYTFPVPAGLPAGKAILAWTWFNKIGNREMYMNCAPIILAGPNTRRDGLESRNATQLVERDQSFYNALPNMFKANIGNCVTKEGINILFPNPGSSRERNDDIRPFSAPPTECAAGNEPPSQIPAPAPTPTPTSAAGPAPTITKRPVKATLPGGVFIEKPTTTSKSAPTAPVVSRPASSAPVVSRPASSAPAPTKATTLIVIPTKATTSAKAPVATGGASGVQSGPCSQEGRWNCIGGSSFQQCASGSWSTPQALAAGTECTTGQSDAIDIKAIGTRNPVPANSPSQPASKPKTKTKKRVVRVNKKHLHRHQAGRS